MRPQPHCRDALPGGAGRGSGARPGVGCLGPSGATAPGAPSGWVAPPLCGSPRPYRSWEHAGGWNLERGAACSRLKLHRSRRARASWCPHAPGAATWEPTCCSLPAPSRTCTPLLHVFTPSAPPPALLLNVRAPEAPRLPALRLLPSHQQVDRLQVRQPAWRGGRPHSVCPHSVEPRGPPMCSPEPPFALTLQTFRWQRPAAVARRPGQPHRCARRVCAS